MSGQNILEFGADDTAIIRCYERAIKLARKSNKAVLKSGLIEESTYTVPGPWLPVDTPKTVKDKMYSSGDTAVATSPTQAPEESPQELLYPIGSFCRAIWDEDSKEYEAEIIDIIEDIAIVRFIGFGNEEEIEIKDLKPSQGKGAQDLQRVAAYEYDLERSELANDAEDPEDLMEEEEDEEEDEEESDDQETVESSDSDQNSQDLPEFKVESVSKPEVLDSRTPSTPYINAQFKIGLIGTGGTLKNLFVPLLEHGMLDPSNLLVYSAEVEHLGPWAAFSCITMTSLATIMTDSDVVVWATSPQAFPKLLTLAASLKRLNFNSLHISLIEDLPLEEFRSTLKRSFILPNNKLLLRTARVLPLVFNPHNRTQIASLFIPWVILDEERTLCKALFGFGGWGMCFEIREDQIHAYKTLLENGMALLLPVLETLEDAGVAKGVSRGDCSKIWSSIMKSAAESRLHAPEDMLSLRDSLTKQGPGIEGLLELEKGGVRSAFIKATEVMYSKAEEGVKRKKNDRK